MRKRLMVIALLALSITVASGALAAKFPGATVGFQWNNDPSVYTILTLKLNGTAKMDSPMKFYTVSGITFDTAGPAVSYPVSGSAYVRGPAGGQHLKFSLSGTFTTEFIDLEGVIYQTLAVGVVIVRGSVGNVWETPVEIPITPLTADQIKALIIPY
jgi:hypothetical protein